jgi:hypothetical protein
MAVTVGERTLFNFEQLGLEIISWNELVWQQLGWNNWYGTIGMEITGMEMAGIPNSSK